MTRRTRVFGLAAFGFLVAGTAHALPEGWYTLGPAFPYKWHGGYVATGDVRPIAAHYFPRSAEDIRTCQRLCDTTAGCTN